MDDCCSGSLRLRHFRLALSAALRPNSAKVFQIARRLSIVSMRPEKGSSDKRNRFSISDQSKHNSDNDYAYRENIAGKGQREASPTIVCLILLGPFPIPAGARSDLSADCHA